MIFISKQDRDTGEYCDFKICKVVAVGKYDLICEKSNLYSSKLFKISKNRCLKIDKKKFSYKEHKTHDPKIGDLVLSINSPYGKDRETYTGLVENIIYDPTDQFNQVYIVRTGQKTIKAYLENIIVLETSK